MSQALSDHLVIGSIILRFIFTQNVADKTASYNYEGTMDTMQEDLSWFYSDEWQAMEDEADDDYREGRMKSYDSVGDLLASL